MLASCGNTETGPTTVEVVGDSITAQAFWGRDAAFEAGAPEGAKVSKDAQGGTKLRDATERVERLGRADAPAVLVLAVGTNNAALIDGGGPLTTTVPSPISSLPPPRGPVSSSSCLVPPPRTPHPRRRAPTS